MSDKSIEKVAVIIPNLNGEAHLREAIDSILAQSYKATLMVVENASIDGSLRILESYGKRIVLIKNSKNLGFAGGVNTGIVRCLKESFDGIALFNNDAIADTDWLQNLVSVINTDTQIGAVTCLLLHSDSRTIDSTGEMYSKWGLPFPRSRNRPPTVAPSSGFVFGASGGATLYRAELFKDIGLFDENFFAYYEDTDISFRGQLAGWKIQYCNSAIAYHIQGATSKKLPGFTVHQTFKNLPLLFLKNVPKSLLFSIGIRFYFAYTLMYLNAIKSGNAIPASKGLLKGVVLSFKSIPSRRLIQKNKRVSDRYVKSILWNDLPPDQSGIRKIRKALTGIG